MTRVLVIGYGSIGRRHSRLLTEMGVEVAVLSRRAIDFPNTYGKLEQALSEWRPTHVIIASRTNEHFTDFENLIQWAYSGAVLVEKPLFDDHYTVPEHQFSHVHIAFNFRFHPLIQAFKKALKGRAVYAMHAYVGQYLPDWRPDSDYRDGYSASRSMGGGVLRDLCHEIDLVQWLAGPYQSVTALGGNVSNLEIDSDDVFALLVALEKCPIATITMNYLDTVLNRELIAHTDRGTVRADLVSGSLLDGTVERVYKIERDTTYKSQLEAFLDPNPDGLCSLEDGLTTLKIIAAAETASLEKKWLEV